jgi:hypothetical protein
MNVVEELFAQGDTRDVAFVAVANKRGRAVFSRALTLSSEASTLHSPTFGSGLENLLQHRG